MEIFLLYFQLVFRIYDAIVDYFFVNVHFNTEKHIEIKKIKEMVFLHFAYMLHIFFLKKYFSFQNRKCQKCVTHWTKKRDIFYCTTKTVIFIIRMSYKKRISEANAIFLLLVEFYFYGFHIISNIFFLSLWGPFFANCLFLCLVFRYYALKEKRFFVELKKILIVVDRKEVLKNVIWQNCWKYLTTALLFGNSMNVRDVWIYDMV